MVDPKTYLGIDVRTGSARAGLFSAHGALLGTGSVALETNHPQSNFVEQSSSQVWTACCSAARAALAQADIEPASVTGIGFDATCSLVVIDREDQPLSASPSGDDRWNIMVWMDHRAIEQASRIDATGDPILQRTGGKIVSVQMIARHKANRQRRTKVARYKPSPEKQPPQGKQKSK